MKVNPILAKIREQIGQSIYLGASLALYDGQAWQEHYCGQSQPGVKTSAAMIYDLASVSKVVGAGTVAIFLHQAGRLDLDRSLQAYYPAFQEASVTIRQLLTHSSGIDPYIADRDSLDAEQLKAAINAIKVTADKRFRYTDVNFLLLGFMLEEIFGQPLDQIFQQQVFQPFDMQVTSFGPVSSAVPSAPHVPSGTVHDPKAQVLGVHTGSAGLFSNLSDLEKFLDHYLQDDFAKELTQNYSKSNQERSLAWDLQGDWLLHTGYTGTFILVNIPLQRAAIFLSNRTYQKDERAQWILDRNALIKIIKNSLEEDY